MTPHPPVAAIHLSRLADQIDSLTVAARRELVGAGATAVALTSSFIAMRAILITLALLSAPSVVFGQQATQTARRATPGTTALTVGYLNVDFDLTSPDGTFEYVFNGPTKAAMLSTEDASVSVGYGTQPLDSSSGRSLRLVDGQLSAGGNMYLLRGSGNLPVSAYVPIRLNLGHRYVNTFGGDESNESKPDPIHLSRAAISAGGGASMRLPTSLPVIGDNVIGFATLTFGIGATGNVQGGIEDVHLLRTRDFHIQLKVEKLLSNVGGTIGYVHRTQKWDQESITDPSEILEKLDSLPERTFTSTQHMVYIGINF